MNTKSKDIDVAPELKALIDYIGSQVIPQNDAGIKRIADAVTRANLREDLEGMMTYEEEFMRMESIIKELNEKNEAIQADKEALQAEKSETSRKLKAAGIDPAVIAECTGLTIEQIEEL